jgi:hypothetical protein
LRNSRRLMGFMFVCESRKYCRLRLVFATSYNSYIL